MATYVEIASVTVGSGGTAQMTFSSIPSTYTDLFLVTSLRSTRTPTAYDDILVKFNTSAGATTKSLQGSGSSVSSFSTANFLGQADTSGNTASTFSSAALYVPNYTASTAKSYSADVVQEQNGTTAYANITAGLWNDTSTINRIDIYCGVGNLAEFSTAYLYGIKKD